MEGYRGNSLESPPRVVKLSFIRGLQWSEYLLYTISVYSLSTTIPSTSVYVIVKVMDPGMHANVSESSSE